MVIFKKVSYKAYLVNSGLVGGQNFSTSDWNWHKTFKLAQIHESCY